MIIPVRCFSCGKVVGNKWEEYNRRVTQGQDSGAVLRDMKIHKYCCRRMILSHVPLIDTLIAGTDEPENYKFLAPT